MMPGGLAAGAEESHFAAAAVQTRPPPAMLEVRSSWQLQLTTADLIPPLHLCGTDVDVFSLLVAVWPDICYYTIKTTLQC